MQYLVEMKPAAHGRPTGGPEDGITLIEKIILPGLEACKQLEDEREIVAGEPASGAIRLIMIVNAGSAQEPDELIESLPAWSRMETTVVPLASLSGRMVALRPMPAGLKARLQNRQRPRTQAVGDEAALFLCHNSCIYNT